MSTKAPSRVVFVGNIPYGLSEEQISELFSSAGQVLNFRLVYDRDTGRPKGFGFAEYPDSDSAASAVRNLNDHDIMGRKLRVDFSNDNNAQGSNDDSGPHDRNQSRAGNSNNNNSNNFKPPPSNGAEMPTGGSLPPLPAGVTLPPGVTITDHISRTLNTLPPTQLLDILSSMKQLCVTDPSRASDLLTQAPQLSYAVFQALLLMGLVSPEAINPVLEPGSAAPPVPNATPAGYPPAPAAAYAPPPPVAPTPVVQHAAPAPAAAAPDPNADALIQQVLSLPDDVIAALPEAERAQILQLRAQFAGQRV
ncbi:unnamed protein product [Discula destructiva]